MAQQTSVWLRLSWHLCLLSCGGFPFLHAESVSRVSDHARRVVMRSNPWPQQKLSLEDEYSSHRKTEDWEEDELLETDRSDEGADQIPINGTVINTSTNGTVTTIYYDKDYSHVATAIGMMLLGMVTFTMTLFYATHFPDSEVQHATWLTLSESVSLMLAVLCFTSFKDIMVLQFGETGGHHHEPPDIKSLIISFVRLFLAFAGVHVMLMKYRHTVIPLKAWGSIGGNVVAFAGIDAFGMVQQFKPFNANPANAFLAMCIAGFMILCMCISAHLVRNWIMTYEDGIIKEHEKNWNDQCKSVENQFAAICLGMLFSVVIRYAISGSLPAVWGSPMYKTTQQVWTLFGVTMGFSLPVFGLAMTVNALSNMGSLLPAIVRAAKVCSLVVAMCQGWSFVFWGQWAFYSATDNKGVGLGDKMTARFVDALFMSYIGFVLIMVLDFLADHMKVARGGFRAVQTAFVLAVGITWEGAFSEAVSAMSYKFEDRKLRAYMDALMTIMLCIVIVPAWIWYMLPKALAGPQPIVSLEEELKKGKAADPQAEAQETGATEEGASKDMQSPEGEVCKEVCASCGTPFEEETSAFCQNCGEKRSPKTPTESNEGETNKGTLGGYSSGRTGKKTPTPETVTAPSTNQPIEPEENEASRLTSGAYSSSRGQPKAATGGKAVASGGKGGRSSTGKAQPQQVTAAPWDQPETDENWTGGSGEDQQNDYADGGGDVSF